MPVSVFVTVGTPTDGQETCALRGDAEGLLTDRDCITECSIRGADEAACQIAIPAGERKKFMQPDWKRHAARYLVSDMFLHGRRWTGIAVRYANEAPRFLPLFTDVSRCTNIR